MVRLLALLLALVCGAAGAATGTSGVETFFVRPISDCPNNGDGLSFACAASAGATGAWHMSGVSFSTTTGVDDGDIVKFCGSFAAADFDTSTYMLFVNSSMTAASESARITFDGDCSAYMTNPGRWKDRNGVARTGAVWDGEYTLTYGINATNDAGNNYLTVKNIEFKRFTTAAVSTKCSPATSDPVAPKYENIYCESVGKCINTAGLNYEMHGITALHTSSDAIFVCNGLGAAGYGKIVDTLLQDVTATVNGATDSTADGIQIEDQNAGALIEGSTVSREDGAKSCWIMGSSSGTNIADDLVCLKYVASATSFGGITVDGAASGSRVSRMYSEAPGTHVYFRDDLASFAGTMIFSGLVLNGGIDGIKFEGAHPASAFTITNVTMVGLTGNGVEAQSGFNPLSMTIRNVAIDAARYLSVASGIAASDIDIDYTTYLSRASPSWLWLGTTYTALSSWQAAAGKDSHSSSVADLGLTGGVAPTTAAGFKLLPSSPLRRTGADLNLGNIQDHGNRAFLHPPSIGAWEATSGDAALERTAR